MVKVRPDGRQICDVCEKTYAGESWAPCPHCALYREGYYKAAKMIGIANGARAARAAHQKKPDPEITFQIARLSLHPGDVLVIKSPFPLSAQQAEACREWFADAVPAGVEMLICDSRLELSVIEKGMLIRLSPIGAR